jgi:hypothetical protein
MTKDEFKNRLAGALYDTYEADDPNILGVYANSIEFKVEETSSFSADLFIYYTRERKVGGNDTTGYILSDLEELMEMICDD